MQAEQMGILFNLDYVPRSYSAPSLNSIVEPSFYSTISNPIISRTENVKRTMWVTLPEAIEPGAILTIQSPDECNLFSLYLFILLQRIQI